MTYLRNTWYVAAWESEITRALSARDILGDSILMYRKQDGTPVALANRCPHRYAPLSMGRLKGDIVECGYHGLQFDCTGQCVFNPHPGGNGPIPRGAKVAQYPLIEKYGAVWIWMGLEAPDESRLPDIGWLEEPATRSGDYGFRRRNTREIRGMCVVDAHYELVVDNLLDISRLPCPSENRRTDIPEYLDHAKIEEAQEGAALWCTRLSQAGEASSDFKQYNSVLAEFKCDRLDSLRWTAPGHVAIVSNCWKSDTDKEHLTRLYVSTMLTPASDGKTWQFWSIARDFGLDSDEFDLVLRETAAAGLEKAEVEAVEAQWRYVNKLNLSDMRRVQLPVDTTPDRVRRALARMIAEEQGKEPIALAPASQHQTAHLTA
jgi:vanillate O-demethylase monooxygenase subunit